MKPEIAKEVPAADWELFEKVRGIVSSLPEEFEGPAYILGARMPKEVATGHFIPDCHTITRALAKFLPVDVHDGLIVETSLNAKPKQHKHSWLTRKNSDGRVIIDPWPLGVVSGPALFIQDYAFHFGRECVPLFTQDEYFKRNLAVVRYEMRKIIRAKETTLQAAA